MRYGRVDSRFSHRNEEKQWRLWYSQTSVGKQKKKKKKVPRQMWSGISFYGILFAGPKVPRPCPLNGTKQKCTSTSGTVVSDRLMCYSTVYLFMFPCLHQLYVLTERSFGNSNSGPNHNNSCYGKRLIPIELAIQLRSCWDSNRAHAHTLYTQSKLKSFSTQQMAADYIIRTYIPYVHRTNAAHPKRKCPAPKPYLSTWAPSNGIITMDMSSALVRYAACHHFDTQFSFK